MNTPSEANPDPAPRAPHRPGCLFFVRRGLLVVIIILAALVLLGLGYQNLATALDRRAYSPRGELYPVDGHQMHIICMGEGSPAVILQAGGGADSLWWYRIQQEVSTSTRVCAYDRAGLGWSEPAPTPRDPATNIEELHALLAAAGVPPPYVMVGHSYGAILARVYTVQYPEDVAAMVLVDSYTVGLVDQSEVDNARLPYLLASLPVKLLAYLGVPRLSDARNFQDAGFPPEIIPELAALHTWTQSLETDEAEKGLDAYLALATASAAASDLADRPLAVLWSSASNDTYDPDAMAEVATYSTNSVTRVIADSNHWSLLGDERPAHEVSAAILDVIAAAETGAPLTP